MLELSYRLTFHTPAFLGNAEQAAQWRTPPVKALLRQWWRVVYAANHASATVADMRGAEGRLFGHAWLDDDFDDKGRKVAARRSAIRLRLSNWNAGTLKTWAALDQHRIVHPEVNGRDGRPAPVGAQLYLGYGPLNFAQGATALKRGAAVDAGESAQLALACPSVEDAQQIQASLALASRFGTLGGRCRNGWGSLALMPLPGTPAFTPGLDARCTLPWRDALQHDWPQAIGTDQGRPLIWRTKALPGWPAVMRRLAEIKIALRRNFLFPDERPDRQVHDRHWLSYPVTTHNVRDWDRTNLRLPNSLRFKVRPGADGQLHGVVFHMPCLPPPAFKPERMAIERVWQTVHQHLDADKALCRIAA